MLPPMPRNSLFYLHHVLVEKGSWNKYGFKSAEEAAEYGNTILRHLGLTDCQLLQKLTYT